MNLQSNIRLLLAASAISLAAGQVHAQGPTATPSAEPDKNETAEIVVTGTSGRQVKFEAPYTITTIGKDQIQRQAPHSVADLLKSKAESGGRFN